MMYRFDAAWNGEVVAEARSPQLKSYLGHNFPASDIPKQARDLFADQRPPHDRGCGLHAIAADRRGRVAIHRFGAVEPAQRLPDPYSVHEEHGRPGHPDRLARRRREALGALVPAITRAGQNILDRPPATRSLGHVKISRPCSARPRRASFESASTSWPRSVGSRAQAPIGGFRIPDRDGDPMARICLPSSARTGLLW